jgi:hypothetical protein
MFEEGLGELGRMVAWNNWETDSIVVEHELTWGLERLGGLAWWLRMKLSKVLQCLIRSGLCPRTLVMDW